MIKNSLKLSEIVERFKTVLIGDADYIVNKVSPLEAADSHSLTFIANPKYLNQVKETRAGAVLITKKDYEKLGSPKEKNYLLTSNPYACFARISALFFEQSQPSLVPTIAKSAVIDSSVKIANTAVVGPNVVIEANAVVGNNVRLDANVFIGQGTIIEDNVHIYPNATVYHGCQIGKRTIIHAGAVIGADGFGFAPDFTVSENKSTSSTEKIGEWIKIPQIGGVLIASDVEIGANTTIDRGTLSNTIIEEGVKIDNQVQIGHNCKIGAYTVIAGCAGIAGSTIIGKHCMIGGAVGIAGQLTLSEGVIVTAQSGVSKSLTKAGIYTSAFPAIDNERWNRNAAIMRNLEKMREQIKRIEADIKSTKIH